MAITTIQKCFSSLYYVTTPGSISGDRAHTSPGEKQYDVSAANVTVTVLRREILAGKHYSGEQLREVQLAARLQVSRNTIRQVYQKLESEGLLTHIPHHGVFIASFDKEHIHELYAFRHITGCGTLRSLNTSRAKLLGEEIPFTCGSQSSLNLPERNNAFHLAIARASGSSDLLATAESIQAQLRLRFLSYLQSTELHARYANRYISIARAFIEDMPNHAADPLSAYLNESFGAVTVALPLADRS